MHHQQDTAEQGAAGRYQAGRYSTVKIRENGGGSLLRTYGEQKKKENRQWKERREQFSYR
jgi:hypothetical protein